MTKRKTARKIAFQKQTVAELEHLVEGAGCDEAKDRFRQFKAALKRAKIPAKTPISAGTIFRLAGQDALDWLADNRRATGDQGTARRASQIRDEILNNVDELAAEKLDAELAEG